MRKSPSPKRPLNGRSGEIAALQAASRALVENRTFDDAARAILVPCKTILGAGAGLVARRADAGKGFEIAVLDAGSREIGAAAGLPAPLRRLSARAVRAGRAAFGNRLSKDARAAPPGTRPAVGSALVAPIVIEDETAGLLGLIDKPGGFSTADCRLAEVFAELVAVAMLRSRTIHHLETTRAALENEAREASAELSRAAALLEASVALARSLDRETVLTTLLDRLRRIVPCDRASVMLREEASRLSVRAVFDGDRVVPLAPELRSELDAAEHPIVHLILTTGTAVRIPDVRERADWSLPPGGSLEASWMGVPLLAGGDVAGLFSLSKREPGYFDQRHESLAEAMSSQASVAVENAVLFEQMQASTARMQSLSRRLVDAQESERRHIARELHDEAGQALASLRFGLRVLEREIETGGSVADQVAELVQRTDTVIDGLHRLAADLRPASLDHLGLAAALRQYSRSVAAQYGLRVRFKARGLTGERLPSAVETALYRVVQEAMTNLVRHARATRVDVLVERRDGRILVMVEDDGVGFQMDRVQRGEHFGLLGLRERAEALGGSLTVESAPGKGTTVVVEVPSDDPHPDR